MAGSALIGQPPNTEQDYYIVKGMLRLSGLFTADPAEGIALASARPLDARFETRGPLRITIASVLIAYVIFLTGTRLLARAFSRSLRWGWDDWIMIPAAVSVLFRFPFCAPARLGG